MSGLFVICSAMVVWGATAATYCTEQILNIESFPGDSVGIPCRFVYTKSIGLVSDVEIAWKAGPHHYCGNEINNKSRNYTAPRYQGRLSVMGDPRTGNVALTLMNVTAADGVNYCCRILLRLPDGTTRQWQSASGTKLTIRGPSEMTVHQPPLIPALAGDTVTIPCHFYTNDKVSVADVQWGYGSYSACATATYGTTGLHGNNLEGQSTQLGAGLASIQIHQVKRSDSGWYCCKLRVTGDGKSYSRERNIGTYLFVKGVARGVNGRAERHLSGYESSSTLLTSEIETSICDSEEDDAMSRFSSSTEQSSASRLLKRHRRRRKQRPPRLERTSSFSSVTDSTMSLNIITVTLNMEKYNFLGISIVGQSNERGDGGIYIGSIMKGGAVAADGRIEPGDMLLQVNDINFENMSNDDAVRVLRDIVHKPGPIILTVAKCWDPSPQGYFTLPRNEPIQPIDPAAWRDSSLW
eukprot:XP_017948187.1 PREDICTED: uncharacterized protein LOC101733100 [Xenopus tropicalis]